MKVLHNTINRTNWATSTLSYYFQVYIHKLPILPYNYDSGIRNIWNQTDALEMFWLKHCISDIPQKATYSVHTHCLTQHGTNYWTNLEALEDLKIVCVSSPYVTLRCCFVQGEDPFIRHDEETVQQKGSTCTCHTIADSSWVYSQKMSPAVKLLGMQTKL